ncbi:hypothetical protein GE107_11020 [Cohnella sp. CFH 77786]|uniref:anti-sigma factor n=1 Tax=Cohnella sp. CFH 77786 TaxID=2662265 RepID=UPI001C609165|nr:anti-sigma factor [Cohnella sp. CFH 77786]MBW5446591.1 hypothetical protein [Cohnella sp. CFH 77786]
MDPFDKEIKEQLGQGPFARGGFDQRLRQRIKDRIAEEREGGQRRPRTASWRMPAVTLAAFAAILLGVWLWHALKNPATLPDRAAAPSVQAVTASPSPQETVQPTKKYALLIGLRADRNERKAFTTSTYRTALVAPEGSDPDKLKLWAENEGLYVPFGQNFWKISTVSTQDGRQALQAVQVTNRNRQSSEASVQIPDRLLSERVMYAGNTYLSIESTVLDGKGNSQAYAWVKNINQINSKGKVPEAEPHIPLVKLFENAEPELAGTEQWGISRNPGQWVATSREGDILATALPDTIVKHDRLALSWEEIQKIEPGAKDAFMYGTVLGVVTGTEIRVYSIRDGAPLSEAVTVKLAGRESVVMIQWAQNDKIDYVEKWINDMRELSREQP